ncbi:MAG: hypothetical protein U0835_02450 [Isosphaeraceae bacterium]
MEGAGLLGVGRRGGPHVREGGLDLGPAGAGEAFAGGGVQLDRGERLLGVAVVRVEVLGDEGVEQAAAGRCEGALFRQQVGERPVGTRPGAEGGDELVAGHHPGVQGEQAEKQVARGGVASRHEAAPGPSRPLSRRQVCATADKRPEPMII